MGAFSLIVVINLLNRASMSNDRELYVFGQLLADQKASLGARFDALFRLRSMKTVDTMQTIAHCLLDSSEDSALLKHELAYCIGQMQLAEAIPFLSEVLENEKENVMVRHEAGEALGAIGDDSALTVLERYKSHSD